MRFPDSSMAERKRAEAALLSDITSSARFNREPLPAGFKLTSCKFFFNKRVVSFQFRQPSVLQFQSRELRPDGRYEDVWVWPNDIDNLKVAVVAALDRLGNLYDNARFQVLFHKVENAKGINFVESAFNPRGIKASDDPAALSDLLQRWFDDLDEADAGEEEFGSDTVVTRADIVSSVFNIKILNMPIIAGVKKLEEKVGNFKEFWIDSNGIRHLRTEYYQTRDSVLHAKQGKCWFWALQSAVMAKPFSCRNINALKSRQGITLDTIRPIVAEINEFLLSKDKPQMNVRIINDKPNVNVYDTPKGKETAVSDDIYTIITPEVVTGAIEDVTLVLSHLEEKQVHVSLLEKRLSIQNPNPAAKKRKLQASADAPKIKGMAKQRKSKKKPFDAVLVWDFETVFDIDGELIVYSYAFCLMNPTTGEINDVGYVSFADLKKDIIGKDDLVQLFLDEVYAACRNFTNVIMVGFNCSRFDCYPLQRTLMNTGQLSNHSVFIAGNSMLKIKWTNGETAFTTWDLHRMVMSSLAKAAKDFGCDNLKGTCDHSVVQAAYEQGHLKKFLIDRYDELKKYNVQDVKTTAELYMKVTSTLNKILNLPQGKTAEFSLTLASLSEQAWKDNRQSLLEAEFKRTYKGPLRANARKEKVVNYIEKNKVKAAANMERTTFFRSAMFGGRAQAFKVAEVRGDFRIIDMRSQYPFVMTERPFPVGDEQPTDKYVPGKIGCYDVTIHFQKEDIPNVTPRRLGKGIPLDWTYKGEMKCTLFSVDIEDLQLYHGNDCVTIHGGYYWPKDSYEVFKSYLAPIVSGKNQQDTFKEAKSGEYNPAARAMFKLLMNSLSGKVAQRIHNADIELLNNASAYDKKMANVAASFYEDFTIHTVGNNQLVFQGKYSNAALAANYDQNKTHPCHQAGLIYAYARREMMKVYVICGSRIGTDTDSIFIEQKDYDLLRTQHPHMFGPELGKFTEEVDDLYADHKLTNSHDQSFLMIAPKCYALYDNVHNKLIKARFKGIPEKAKRLDYDVIDKMPAEDQAIIRATFGEAGDQTTSSTREVFNGYKALSLLPNAMTVELYRDILKKKPVYIVQSQIVKQLFSDKDMGVLLQRFQRKSVALNKAVKLDEPPAVAVSSPECNDMDQ